MIRLENVPGYVEAVTQENLVRDAAFFGLTETVAGYELVQMNMSHWLVLRLARNPLLSGGTPSPIDLAQFLWLLSPNWNAGGKGRNQFLRRCRRDFAPSRFLKRNARRIVRGAEIVHGCREYLKETFQDRPANSARSFSAPHYSDMALFVSILGRMNVANETEAMAMPLKRLFQYVKIYLQRETDVPIGNHSDSVLNAWLAERNAARARN